MNVVRIQSVTLFIVLLCAAGFAAHGYFSGSIKNASPQEKWTHRIAAIGAPAAYEEFAKSVEGIPSARQHTEAHYFGIALYKEKGVDGLSVCDERFGWGCFHQFIGMAIMEHGESIVPRLQDTCLHTIVKLPKTCIHAIGHGLLAYTGYSEENLHQALTLCDSMPAIGSRTGNKVACYRGVFMEYNLRGMLGEDATVRPLTDGDLQYPCDKINDELQLGACYHLQPQWWRRLIVIEQKTRRNAISTYTTIGKRCSELDTKVKRDSCYSGIGNSIAWDLTSEPQSKPPLCEVASRDPNDQLLCKIEIAEILRKMFAYEPEDGCFGLQIRSDLYKECIEWDPHRTP